MCGCEKELVWVLIVDMPSVRAAYNALPPRARYQSFEVLILLATPGGSIWSAKKDTV